MVRHNEDQMPAPARSCIRRKRSWIAHNGYRASQGSDQRNLFNKALFILVIVPAC